ncbi:MAG: NAD(P)/FAD-dependent oxidoreductase [Patescibacteria group bacterium]
MKKYDIIIIGGGAAGMMAGISSSRDGRSVLIVEKNYKLGRKVLVTGNGRCNVTNRFVDKSRYYGASPEFVEKVLSYFDQFRVMEFFESLGVMLKEEDNGRMFPRTNQAETIVNALTEELKEKKVKIISDQPVVSLIKKENIFQVKLKNNEEFSAEKVILTTGGRASGQYGSTGDGFRWLENLGHHILFQYPALVPLETQERWPKGLAGLKVAGRVKAESEGKILAEKEGEVLFTHFGLSGPPILFLSSFISPILGKNKVKINLDLFPESTAKDLDVRLEKIFESSGKKSVKNALAGMLPANFIPVFLKNINIQPEKKTAEISKTERLKIVDGLKNITLTVTATRPFSEAHITAGGVDTGEVNPATLESKIIPGLYLAGEILDVNADSGGFNLQWAWSSGRLAGFNAAS